MNVECSYITGQSLQVPKIDVFFAHSFFRSKLGILAFRILAVDDALEPAAELIAVEYLLDLLAILRNHQLEDRLVC